MERSLEDEGESNDRMCAAIISIGKLEDLVDCLAFALALKYTRSNFSARRLFKSARRPVDRNELARDRKNRRTRVAKLREAGKINIVKKRIRVRERHIVDDWRDYAERIRAN